MSVRWSLLFFVAGCSGASTKPAQDVRDEAHRKDVSQRLVLPEASSLWGADAEAVKPAAAQPFLQLPATDQLSRLAGEDDGESGPLRAAERLLTQGDFAGAERAFRKAGGGAPAVAGLMRTMVERAQTGAVLGTGGRDKVLREAAKAGARWSIKPAADRGDAQVIRELGRVALLQGDAEAAASHFERVLQYAPDDAESVSGMGLSLFALGRGAEAIPKLERAAELDRTAERYLNLGTVLLAAGKTIESLPSLEQAHGWAPEDAKIGNAFGAALLSASQPARARPILEAVVQREPNNASYVTNLGYCLELSGDMPGAKKAYEKAAALNPKLVGAWINLGNVAAAAADWKAARAAYEKAKTIDPTDPRIAEGLAEIARLSGGQMR